MRRNRSRAVTSNQALMADHHHHQHHSSQSQNCKRPIPSFFGSPRFRAFTNKGLSETEAVMSPTSILDSTKSHTPFCNPFWYDSCINQPKSPKFFSETKHCEGIGLALINTVSDNTIEEKSCSSSETSSNKMVLFGTKLRIQIPPLPPSTLSPTESPKSPAPAELGIKTRNSQLSAFGSASSGVQSRDSPRIVTGSLSVSEMELSEDYTCIISHGPDPKTTHIFDNCIVETYLCLSDKPKSNTTEESFLSFCHTCKKNLEQTNDIYIYRGEKAFCSHECRYQEMLLDDAEN